MKSLKSRERNPGEALFVSSPSSDPSALRMWKWNVLVLLLTVESEEEEEGGVIEIANVCTHIAWYIPLAVRPQRGIQLNCSTRIAWEDSKFAGERENLLNGTGGIKDFAARELHKYRDDSLVVTSLSQWLSSAFLVLLLSLPFLSLILFWRFWKTK